MAHRSGESHIEAVPARGPKKQNNTEYVLHDTIQRRTSTPGADEVADGERQSSAERLRQALRPPQPRRRPTASLSPRGAALQDAAAVRPPTPGSTRGTASCSTGDASSVLRHNAQGGTSSV